RCSFHRFTCVLVTCCMNAGRSPSRSGQTTKCQWLGIKQQAHSRIRRVRSVSSTTRSNAKKSSSLVKSTLRPTPRLSTWKTILPGECRLGRDIHGFLSRYPSFVNLVAVTFSPSFHLLSRHDVGGLEALADRRPPMDDRRSPFCSSDDEALSERVLALCNHGAGVALHVDPYAFGQLDHLVAIVHTAAEVLTTDWLQRDVGIAGPLDESPSRFGCPPRSIVHTHLNLEDGSNIPRVYTITNRALEEVVVADEVNCETGKNDSGISKAEPGLDPVDHGPWIEVLDAEIRVSVVEALARLSLLILERALLHTKPVLSGNTESFLDNDPGAMSFSHATHGIQRQRDLTSPGEVGEAICFAHDTLHPIRDLRRRDPEPPANEIVAPDDLE